MLGTFLNRLLPVPCCRCWSFNSFCQLPFEFCCAFLRLGFVTRSSLPSVISVTPPPPSLSLRPPPRCSSRMSLDPRLRSLSPTLHDTVSFVSLFASIIISHNTHTYSISVTHVLYISAPPPRCICFCREIRSHFGRSTISAPFIPRARFTIGSRL